MTEQTKLSEAAERIFALESDLAECRKIVAGLADRVAAQSELLSRRAEKTPLLDPTPADAEWLMTRPGAIKFGSGEINVGPIRYYPWNGQWWHGSKRIWCRVTVTRGMVEMLRCALKGGDS